jgi:hypothetical protein
MDEVGKRISDLYSKDKECFGSLSAFDCVKFVQERVIEVLCNFYLS